MKLIKTVSQMPLRKVIVFICLVFGIVSLVQSNQSISKDHTSYWLWAGITAKDAPVMKDYYIYQGVISQEKNKTNHQHIGLYPYPIKCSECFLVYRLQAAYPDANGVVQQFLNDAHKWQRHQVPIRGLQIDYDAPTKKLKAYADYLRKLREALPKEYALDITGLVDWVTEGEAASLNAISKQTTDIVYQLYNGRQPLNQIQFYIQRLGRYPHSFRIGLLQDAIGRSNLENLQQNPNYKGIIYFIQKR